jgi:glycerol-3-phosphate dehydrogenase subunit C
MGEYLLFLHARGQLSVTLRFPGRPMVYFAPCHQREQGIGQPYYELIKSLPDADIIHIGGVMQCCGMGGHLGFKTGFHPHSVDIGQPVFDRLANESFRTIITDCLSCRLQFEQVLVRETFHPLEMMVVP